MATLTSAVSVADRRVIEQGVRQHLFTVAEYHRMAEAGVFREDDPIELVEGRLFIKLDERLVEVYENPTGPVAIPEYQVRRVFRSGESIPLVIRDMILDPVPVDDLLPAV
jgi:hypothetical protein